MKTEEMVEQVAAGPGYSIGRSPLVTLDDMIQRRGVLVRFRVEEFQDHAVIIGETEAAAEVGRAVMKALGSAEKKEMWYSSKEGYLSFFKDNYDKVREVVSFFMGAETVKKFDGFKDIGVDETVERYREMWEVLQDTWEKAPGQLDMEGWIPLCDLCSEGSILWKV